jgi:hypothetical protein
VPFESKQHAVGNPHGGENAPTIHESDLAGRQRFLMRVENVVVVEEEAVQIQF